MHRWARQSEKRRGLAHETCHILGYERRLRTAESRSEKEGEDRTAFSAVSALSDYQELRTGTLIERMLVTGRKRRYVLIPYGTNCFEQLLGDGCRSTHGNRAKT